jgi:thiamine transport system substrate-binding protein
LVSKIEKDLGIRLRFQSNGDAGEMVSRAVLTAGRPEGDILLGVDNSLAQRVLDSDVLVASNPPALSEVPVEYQPDATRRLIPIDYSDVCVDYDKKWFADHSLAPPEALVDLVKPEYNGLFVMENPATSTPGSVFLSGVNTSLGTEADTFWKGLAANDTLVVGSWDDAWTTHFTVSGGERPLVLSYASSPPAEVIYSDGKLTEPRSAVALGTCTEQVEFAGVLKGSAHTALATKVIDAMLSTEWQASVAVQNFVYPVRDGVTLDAVFSRWAPVPTDPIRLDPEVVGAELNGWIEQWRSAME